MERRYSRFNYFRGELAYKILWKKTFNCLMSLSMIKSRYLNLELIVYYDKAIVAFRYDTPEELGWLNLNDGEWQMYDIELFSAAIWVNNILLIYRDIK